MSKVNVLVTGLFYSGSGAVCDLLRQYNNIGIVPGEFDDFRRKGMIADHLTGKISGDYPSDLKNMAIRMDGFAEKMDNAKALRDKFMLAQGYKESICNHFARNKEFILFDQPIFYNLHNEVWPLFFEPFKLIVVYRDFYDQIAELIKQHIYFDIETPTRAMVSLFGDSREGAVRYEIFNALNRYESALKLQDIHGADKVCLVSFESLVNDYENQKARIEDFLGLDAENCVSEKKYFNPCESSKNIGIADAILSDNERNIIKSAIDKSNIYGLFNIVNNIFYSEADETVNNDFSVKKTIVKSLDTSSEAPYENPRISVCIASFNHDKYIYSALESVVNQGYENLEIIVVDDCSTDNSVAEIKRFAKNNPIKFIQQEKNQGPSLTSNRAISEAEGEFIALLGSDDLMLPGRLHAQARYLIENKHCVAVMTDIAAVGEDGNVFQHSEGIEGQFNQTYYNLRKQLLAGNFINAPSAMVRREDLLAVQSFSPLLRYVQDYDLWGKLLTRGEINKISMPLTGYRVHGKNLSFGLQGSELIQTRIELVSTIVGFARSWSMQAIAQLNKISAKQEAEIMFGLASILQLVDYNYFKKPSLATSQAYEFILKASYTEPEKAQIAKTQIESVIANGFSSAEALLTDEAVKWFGDLLPRLNVLAEVESSPQSASVENWLSARTILPKQKAVVRQLAQNKNIKISCSCIIANFENNSEAIAITQKNIELQQGALSALTLNPIQVAQLDTFAAQVNEWLCKSDDDWLLVMSAGEELTSSGLMMAQIELAQNPALSAISFDEIYRQENGSLSAALRPSTSLDYLLSFPVGMSRHWLFNRQALLDIGGFNPELPDAFELDAILRLINHGGLEGLGHIAEPLVITQPPALANIDDERKAIEAHLQQRGYVDAQVHAPKPGRYQIRYNHPQQPIVSIVLIAEASLAHMQRCVEGLLSDTTYQNFEVLLFATQNTSSEVSAWLAELASLQEAKLRIFNFPEGDLAEQCNQAALQAIGDYVLFLSADTSVVSAHWLDELLNHAQRGEVGVVGAKLLSPTGKIAHAGHILGLEGPLGSPFVGEHLDAPGYMQRLQVDQNLSAVGLDCFMVLRELFVELDGFAENQLAIEYLSADFCLRAREAGFLTVWTPHAQLMLDQDAQARPSSEQQDAMYEKWLPQLAHDPAYNPNFSLSVPGGFKLADTQISWRPLDSFRPAPVALVHPADLFGCGHYRVMQPFLAMKEAELLDGAISTGLMHVTDLERYNPDTIILQRQIGDERLEAMRRMQRFSKAFKVYELDDYLPNLPLKSVHRVHMPKDILRSLRKGLSYVDRFVVSTESLAEAFSGLHDEIVVMENRLPVSWWQGLQTQRRQGKKPRVGWAGGSSHTGDLELIADVVRDLADEVEWVFLGMCPDKLRPYVHEYHDGVAIEQYPAKLASLNLDLGLAPLEMNLFNECKSNLRLLEYGACGIPVVCTDIRCYQNDFPVTRVRNRYKDWIEAIRMHINDLDRAAKLGDDLQAKVRQEWMLEGTNLELWRKAWLPS